MLPRRPARPRARRAPACAPGRRPTAPGAGAARRRCRPRRGARELAGPSGVPRRSRVGGRRGTASAGRAPSCRKGLAGRGAAPPDRRRRTKRARARGRGLTSPRTGRQTSSSQLTRDVAADGPARISVTSTACSPGTDRRASIRASSSRSKRRRVASTDGPVPRLAATRSRKLEPDRPGDSEPRMSAARSTSSGSSTDSTRRASDHPLGRPSRIASSRSPRVTRPSLTARLVRGGSGCHGWLLRSRCVPGSVTARGSSRAEGARDSPESGSSTSSARCC